mmetsp:Transcript_24386/g.71469  ORF Transcript_24386/g.71469 Transcript_24386/m.71469 type:complete len:215 (-) Transcript_24386:174-818(-)
MVSRANPAPQAIPRMSATDELTATARTSTSVAGGGDGGGRMLPRSSPASLEPSRMRLSMKAGNHWPASGARASISYEREPSDALLPQAASKRGHRPRSPGRYSEHPSLSPGVLIQKKASTMSRPVAIVGCGPAVASRRLHHWWHSSGPRASGLPLRDVSMTKCGSKEHACRKYLESVWAYTSSARPELYVLRSSSPQGPDAVQQSESLAIQLQK